MTPRTAAVVAIALWVAVHDVPAQTVYRCGVEGRSYAQQPCGDGRSIDVGDARADAERHEGEAVAGRQERLARAMERDRLGAPALALRPVRLDGRPAAGDERTGTPADRKTFRAVTGPAKKKPKPRASA